MIINLKDCDYSRTG